MISQRNSFAPAARRRLTRRLAAAGALVAVAGCGSIFDVDNPNNAPETILTDPAAATNFVNGVQHSYTRALAALLGPYGSATDELKWVGSRDAYKQLDNGDISEITNEFVDAGNFYLNEARWMADEAIKSLETFDQNGVLPAGVDLARAYLLEASVYTTIADMFDDYTFSDRATAGPPVGEANMFTVYDKAISNLNKGIVIANALPVGTNGRNELRTRLYAALARAEYSKSVWATVNPVVAANVGTNAVLVSNASANAAATTALTINDGNWKWDLTPTTQNTPTVTYGNEINDRLELRFGDQFVNPNAAGNRTATVKLLDPIDNIVDPVVSQYILDYTFYLPTTVLADPNLVPMTVVSAREMHLILAEAALKVPDLVTFQTHINAVRSLDGLTAWTPASTVTAYNILKHERRVNLFQQGRRLADLYRFGENADLWDPASFAILTKGCFFPITSSERLANQLVTEPASCN